MPASKRSRTCLLVAPHPDDETIGAAMWMERHRDYDITILHTTDGSPRDLVDARVRGLNSRKAYAAARRRELREAIGLLSPGRRRFRCFGYVDKESCLHLEEMVARLAALMGMLQPDIVLSPAYEGGHPDHDTVALAVAVSGQKVAFQFRHLEYRLYHAGPDGHIVTDKFLSSELPCEQAILTQTEQELKSRMLERFTTQAAILSKFGVSDECFRDAPRYDFTKPPHQGELLYERWAIGISGAEWRIRATRFLK